MLAFAKRIGWQIFTRYGVVMCYDPVKLYQESGVLLQAGDGRPVGLPARAGCSSTSSRWRRPRCSTPTSDPSSATSPPTTRSRSPPSLVSSGATSSAPTSVIKDQDDAKVYAAAADVDMDRWKQHAMARIWGDADIYPGMCVEIVTTNRRTSSATSTTASGWCDDLATRWTASSTRRCCSLARPLAHQHSSYRLRALLAETGTRSASPTLTRSRPIEGQWVSSWTNRNASERPVKSHPLPLQHRS